MSLRTGLQIAATGIVLIVVIALAWASWLTFSAYEQGHANERHDAAQYQADASKKGPDSCRAIMDETGFADWFACLADAVSTDGGEKQAKYDLQAQQDMAAWAFGMLIVTCWLTGATLLGVLFVWQTLMATKETVEATREAGRDQGRAYVQLDAVKTIGGTDGGRFEGIIMNFGNTPCEWYDVSYGFAVVLKPKEGVPKSPDISCFKMGESVTARYSCLGPNQPMGLPMGPKKGSKFSFDHATQNLFLMANIKYRTIYGEVIETGTCFILDQNGGNEMKRISMDIPAYRKIKN